MKTRNEIKSVLLVRVVVACLGIPLFLLGIALEEVADGYVYCFFRGLDTKVEFSKNLVLFSGYYRKLLSGPESFIAFLLRVIPFIILMYLIIICAGKVAEYICAWIEKNDWQLK